MNNIPKGYKQTKVGVIPEEWEVVRLKEILSIGSGKDYKHLKKGNIPVYGTGGYMLSVDEYLYDGESVGIGRKGTIDKPIFLNGKFWTVDTLFYTHSFINSIPKYIYFLFLTINWKKYNEASGVPSLSKKTIEIIKIPLPPLKEQQKIAEILTTWDSAISKQEKLIKEKEKLKKGLMQKLLSAEVRFKEFSDEWEEVRLGEIGKIYQSQTISQSDLTSDGFTVYGANGIIGKYTKYNHEYEQVIVTCRGNTCGTINFTKPKSWITGNAMVINLDNSKKANKKFIFYKLSNTNLLYLITGSGQPQITGDIKKHKLKLPSLQEQQKIADVLSTADKEIELLKKELEELKKQKKGLMQRLLSGEVRVKV
jgi:type I restriction enzyme S subunit